MEKDLNRFIIAQENDFDRALSEIRSGRKQSHWMWYIFPQFMGLGYSEISKYYSIQSIDEARSYLDHPVLGSRLKLITSEILDLQENNATLIFGSPDDLKLKSCLTLFAVIDTSEEKLFQKALDKFFEGRVDNKTLRLLKF